MLTMTNFKINIKYKGFLMKQQSDKVKKYLKKSFFFYF